MLSTATAQLTHISAVERTSPSNYPFKNVYKPRRVVLVSSFSSTPNSPDKPTVMKFCCNLHSILTSSEAQPAKPAVSTAFEPLPSPVVAIALESFNCKDFGHSAEALTAWLNARWREPGYKVSAAAVCFALRSQGRDARMGVPDHLDGVMVRPGREKLYAIKHEADAEEREVMAKLLRKLDKKPWSVLAIAGFSRVL